MQPVMMIRESLHRLRRSPRLSAAVVLCIALGMAATSAVVTLVGLTSWRPLPFPEAERLVRIWNTEAGAERRDSLAWVDVLDLRDGMDSLDALEAAARSRLIWHRPEAPGRRVEGEAVTAGYFDLLDIDPYIGRTFTAEEYAAGEPLIMLSHAAWGREFGFDEDILGTTIRTSTQNQGIATTYTVIGVLPPDFHGTIEDDMPDLEFWVPIRSYFDADARGARDLRGVLAVGRLAPGAGPDAAQAEASAIAAALAPEFAAFADNHNYRVEPLGANWRADFTRASGLLGGASGLLLAIAVLNVAMLGVARTLERRHELAVRGALGASRARLVAPLVSETLVLAALGGAIGLVVAGPLLDGFLSLSGTRIPDYLPVRPDPATLAVAFAAMLAAGLGAAALPAWAATRVDLNDALREGSARTAGSRTAARWGRWMVGGQIAMTLALLLTGTLLGRSWLDMGSRDLGFATDNRLRMGLFINPADVPDEAGLPAFVERVERELMAEPGVREVALLWPTVPMPSPIIGRVQWPDMPEGQRDPGVMVSNAIVVAGFFEALEIPLVAGRAFDSRDTGEGVRTTVIGRSLAEQLGSPTAALGREIVLNNGETPYRVVGVVGDTLFGGPDGDPGFDHQMYLSYAQLPRRIVSPVIAVEGDPTAYAERLKRILARVAPDSAVDWVEPVDVFISWLYRDHAFRLALVAAFALSALVLAAIGLYAVLAQQVTAATAEIGIRKALGASDRRILGRILRRGMTVTVAGIAAGIALSLAFIRILDGLLHGVGTHDPLAWTAAVTLMTAVALAACLLPARRAARIAPMEALRHE